MEASPESGGTWRNEGLRARLPAAAIPVVVLAVSAMVLWTGWWARAAHDMRPESAQLHEQVAGAPMRSLPATVTWSVSPDTGDGPGVIANISAPDRALSVRVTFARNTDKTLPVTHVVEVVTNVGAGSAIGPIRSVPSLMVPAIGPPKALAGLSSAIAEGAFFIALSAEPREAAENLKLLRYAHQIALPLVYANGQQAALEFPKSAIGEPFFREALLDWAKAHGTPKP